MANTPKLFVFKIYRIGKSVDAVTITMREVGKKKRVVQPKDVKSAISSAKAGDAFIFSFDRSFLPDRYISLVKDWNEKIQKQAITTKAYFYYTDTAKVEIDEVVIVRRFESFKDKTVSFYWNGTTCGSGENGFAKVLDKINDKKPQFVACIGCSSGEEPMSVLSDEYVLPADSLSNLEGSINRDKTKIIDLETKLDFSDNSDPFGDTPPIDDEDPF